MIDFDEDLFDRVLSKLYRDDDEECDDENDPSKLIQELEALRKGFREDQYRKVSLLLSEFYGDTDQGASCYRCSMRMLEESFGMIRTILMYEKQPYKFFYRKIMDLKETDMTIDFLLDILREKSNFNSVEVMGSRYVSVNYGAWNDFQNEKCVISLLNSLLSHKGSRCNIESIDYLFHQKVGTFEITCQ